jgi:branched-chain amino acid transport system substrate-binding protein
MDANDLRKQYAEGERNFFQANLSGANLSGMNLSEANFDSASLTGSNLSEANLSQANLRLAQLSQADLRGTNLSEAKLVNTNLSEAIYDERTQFPNEFDLVAANLRLHSKTQIVPLDPDGTEPVLESNSQAQNPEISNPSTSEEPFLGSASNNKSDKQSLTPSNNNGKFRKKYLIPIVGVMLAVGAWAVLPHLFDRPKVEEDLTLSPEISSGEKILIENEAGANESFKLLKQAGVQAISEGNYSQAITYLQGAIKENKNSPETLIYLNNAKIGDRSAKTIAVVAPIGSDLDGAFEILRGVAHAQDESNQTNSETTLIKVVIVNDDNKEEIAKQVASSLVNAPEVLGVVGHWASQVSLSVKDIYKSGKLVAISPISTAVSLSSSSPYFFRTVPSDSIAAKALADYMVDRLNLKQAAIFFNSQSTYSQSLKTEFINALVQRGGQVSNANIFDLYDSGFSAKRSVEQAIQQGSEAIVLAPNTDSLYKALAVTQANDKRLPLLGGDDVYGDRTLQDGGATTEGMVVAIAWHVNGSLVSADFHDRSIELWGTGDVNWRTAMSYDAAKALIAAIQQQSQPTRTEIQQVLSSRDFSTKGASGAIEFESSGDRRKPPVQLVKIVKAQPPRTGYIFVPVK